MFAVHYVHSLCSAYELFSAVPIPISADCRCLWVWNGTHKLNTYVDYMCMYVQYMTVNVCKYRNVILYSAEYVYVFPVLCVHTGTYSYKLKHTYVHVYIYIIERGL